MIKKRWEKKGDKFFSRNTRISLTKNEGKNRLDKVRKHVFYKHTNIVKKIGEKNTREKFSKNTRIGIPKNVGKKSSQKSAKTRFL